MEYYFRSSLGLVMISPCEGLPSAVELRIAGRTWATYISSDQAANAVASSRTSHPQLDKLPCWCVPVLLSEWKQSCGHQFKTEVSAAEILEAPAPQWIEFDLPQGELQPVHGY